MAIEDWTVIEAPAWLWGGNPTEMFEAAGLRVRIDGPGKYRVRTEEGYRSAKPDLIFARPFYGGSSPDRLRLLANFAERVPVTMDYARVQKHLDAFAAQIGGGGGIVHILNHAQLALAVTPPNELPGNASSILDGFASMEWRDADKDKPGPFHSPGLVVLSTSNSLHLRLRLPSVFLRIAADERLQVGDLHHLRSPQGESDLLFPSSHGLYEGVYMLDPYIGPLRGSASPSIWCLAAPRTFGTIIVLLGRGISGTVGDATEPLQTILVKGPSRAHKAPEQTIDEQMVAVDWWGRALNELFGALSDPAVFRTSADVYDPSGHLSAVLTIEQLFRRVTSLLVQHRDVITRQALLFTCLDTLEGLTGRDLVNQFTASQAAKCLARVRSKMPEAAQRVLLPCAERAVVAVGEVQQGFSLARQAGLTHLVWGTTTSTFEQAAAHYLVALRNATHGHGGAKGKAEQRERDTTLLIQHNGEIPEDLPLLAYLYLLEVLVDPERLRRILGRRTR